MLPKSKVPKSIFLQTNKQTNKQTVRPCQSNTPVPGTNFCLSQGFHCFEDTMTKATLIKNISLGLAYRFRGSVHYHQGRKNGSIQADMKLEEPKVLHRVPKADRGRLSSGSLEEGFKAHPTLTHFLQQGHTS